MTKLYILVISFFLFISCKNNDEKVLVTLLDYQITEYLQDYRTSCHVVRFSSRKQFKQINSVGRLSREVDSCIKNINSSLPKINGHQNKLNFITSTLSFIKERITNTFQACQNPKFNYPKIIMLITHFLIN